MLLRYVISFHANEYDRVNVIFDNDATAIYVEYFKEKAPFALVITSACSGDISCKES